MVRTVQALQGQSKHGRRHRKQQLFMCVYIASGECGPEEKHMMPHVLAQVDARSETARALYPSRAMLGKRCAASALHTLRWTGYQGHSPPSYT